ncbi:factor associated with metabolism and energy [Anabrus simplex]|uniref:factor associated with metabolism and energy n=1 Tax=Anabrus simplex TaxID=316456 RepID=UPI0035A3A21A
MNMGCGASKRTTTVVPVGDSDTKGSEENIHNNARRTSDVVALQGEDPPAEILKDDKKLSRAQPMAFEVIVNNESLIRKHPPRRLQRLEDQQVTLTHQLLDEKQAEAEQRRNQILTQRVQSAKQRPPRRLFNDDDGGSPHEDVIETIKRENSSVEL